MAEEKLRAERAFVRCGVCARVAKLAIAFCPECGSSLEGCQEVEPVRIVFSLFVFSFFNRTAQPVAADASSSPAPAPAPAAAEDKKKAEEKERSKREKMQRDLESIFSGLDKKLEFSLLFVVFLLIVCVQSHSGGAGAAQLSAGEEHGRAAGRAARGGPRATRGGGGAARP